MKFTSNREKNICYIYLFEAWEGEGEENCIRIIERYAKGKEIFFEFHREYGEGRVEKEVEKYREVIPEFFRKNGSYELSERSLKNKYRFWQLFCKKDKDYFDPRIYAIGKLVANGKVIEMIPYFMDYYFSSMLFVPNSNYSWEDFVKCFYKKPVVRRIEELLNARATDMFFVKSDGGNFQVIFNMDVYDASEVEKYIRGLFGKSWSSGN